MATDLIRYDLRVQEALRGVIRKVLADAAREGLQGDHHFQISFRTDAPGVSLSTAMRRRFQQEMTIILQYQFRELSVSEHGLEVVLFFDHVPERLVIPFSAVTGFFDPSVDFGLRFEVRTDLEPEPVAPPKLVAVKNTPAPLHALPRGAGSEPGEVTPVRPRTVPQTAKRDADVKPAEPKLNVGKAKPAEPAPEPDASKKADDAKTGEAKVVSFDAYRRKP